MTWLRYADVPRFEQGLLQFAHEKHADFVEELGQKADLTAALEISDGGDTVEQPRDDATVEQPRPEVPDLDETGTVALGTDDMSDELSEASEGW